MYKQDLQAVPQDSLSLGIFSLTIFQRHLYQRQYGAVEGLLQLQAIKYDEEEALLGILAKHGFARLLSKASNHAEVSNNPRLAGELLFLACQRTLPNMNVVHVLVENFANDIDATNQVLHQLSRGSHWWQTEEGIPYLLSVGALPTLKALHVALQSLGVFNKEAVSAFINGGANVHSESSDDALCITLEIAFTSACSDVDIVKCILLAGFPITTACVFRAIANKAVAV